MQNDPNYKQDNPMGDETLQGGENAARQRELADEISSLMADGRSRKAIDALLAGVEDVLPDLPLRFSLLLIRVDSEGIKDYIRQYRKTGSRPTLQLVKPKGSGQFVITWRKGRIGQLSSEDSDLLRSFGRRRRLYEPRVLEVTYSADKLKVETLAIELVRPEVRLCSSCGKQHTGIHLNCEECRGKRKRTGDEQDTFEVPPLGLAEAIDLFVRRNEESA